MARVTRDICAETITEEVDYIISELDFKLGLPLVHASFNKGNVIFTAFSETGIKLGYTTYTPNSDFTTRLAFGRRSGVFLANAVSDILDAIECKFVAKF